MVIATPTSPVTTAVHPSTVTATVPEDVRRRLLARLPADPLPMSRVIAAIVTLTGVRVSPSSLERWTSRGVRGWRLKISFVGGRRYVSPSDLVEFLAATGFATH
jgi:hypothetical protein